MSGEREPEGRTAFAPRLGGDHRRLRLSGAEPQLGGARRIDLAVLDYLSRGLWTSIEELKRVARLIPPEQRPLYRDALLKRLALVDPGHLLPEVKPWRGGRDQRVRIIDSLSILGDADIIPLLENLTRDPNAEVRQAAIAALGRLGDPLSVPVLGRILRHPESSTHDRLGAVDALARIGVGEALPCLLEALREVRATLVRRRIVSALGSIPGEAATGALVDVLRRSPLAALREEAALALGRRKDARGMLYLCEALDDPDPAVRLACVRALRGFRGEIARAALGYALSDPDERVRGAASRALRSLKKAS
ncbi:MAG TPA: hypothetical protein ENI95_14995 [Chloroflexi bacterium]|nr:hypothetical protein [Chloroflexota bacterium]